MDIKTVKLVKDKDIVVVNASDAGAWKKKGYAVFTAVAKKEQGPKPNTAQGEKPVEGDKTDGEKK